MVDTGTLASAAAAAASAVGPARGRRAVGEEHDARRRLLPLAGRVGRVGEGVERGEDGFADGRARPEAQVVEALEHGLALGGGRHEHGCAARERQQAESEPGRQVLGERTRRVAGRGEAARARRRWPASRRRRRWRASPSPARGGPSPPASAGRSRPRAGRAQPASAAAGRWRRQPGRFGAHRREQGDVGEAHRVAPPAELHRGSRRRRARRRAASSHRRSPARNLTRVPPGGGDQAGAQPAAGGDEADDVEEPVAVGAQHEVRDRGAAQRRGRSPPAGRWLPPRSARRTLVARGLHLDAAPGLGVDEGEEPDGRQLELARVEHLDREHLVAPADGCGAAAPSPAGSRKSEITTTRPRRRASGPTARRARLRSGADSRVAAAVDLPGVCGVDARVVASLLEQRHDRVAARARRHGDQAARAAGAARPAGCPHGR